MKINKILSVLFLLLISISVLGCDNSSHTHEYIDGECSCGEVDPNYQSHYHNYVNGVCSCGETDPNYQEHVHEFIEGKCSCGEIDSTYNPNIEVVKTANGALTVEYSKVIYYTQKGFLKVTSTKANDEIKIRSMTSSIISVDDEATDDYILLGKKMGIGKIQISNKYGDSIVINISVEENEEFSAIHEINIRIKEEGPIYMGEIYHLDLEIIPSNYIDKYSILKSDEYILNLETMEIMFKHSGSCIISAYAEEHGVRVNQEFNIGINPDKESYEILFIGNSLTYVDDIPGIVYNMITADGAYVSYLQDTVGGSYLDEHKIKFEEYVNKHNFTHIILQEQSAGSLTDFNRFKQAVKYYCDELGDRDVEIILYQTWGYNYANGWNGMTKHEMTERIKQAYDIVAEEVGATVTRSGEAFTLYETMYDDLPSLYKDVNHQSLYGAYLSACVHYCTITGKSAVNNTFEFEGIDAEISLIIRQIADELVLGNK